MSSLPSHLLLLETGDHGRLDFHPSCPVCRRERLVGMLRSRPVVSRRLQAALATGVLAFSAAAPAVAAIPPERDRQQEGVAAPERPTSGGRERLSDGVDDPDFDPGGDTALPFAVGAPDTAPTDEEDGDTGLGPPIDVEPREDPSAHVIAPDEPDSETPAGGDAPVPPAEAAPVPPPPASAEPTPAPPPPATMEAPAEADEPASPDSRGSKEKSEPGRDRGSPNGTTITRPDATTRTVEPRLSLQSSRPARAGDVAPTVPQLRETSPLPAQTARASASEQVAVASPSAPAEEGPRPLQGQARFYVVQSGDSLWSIARTLLGPSASPARIAREVDRLWELNKDRIGTGNPDLLMVGTKLRLR
jgi:LysM domain